MLRSIRVLTVVLTLALAACGQSTPSMPAQIDVKVTGTGGGLRSFCNGDDVDIVNAKRHMLGL